jgi:hypothetical protein
MNLLRLSLPIVAVLLFAPLGLRAQAPTPPSPAPHEPTIQSGGEVAATAAVEVWLAVVDDHRYADSWQTAASIFKKAVPQEQWVALMNSRRAPLGKVLSRHAKGRQFTRTLPGAPDGQYVVCQYETSFENRKSAAELVSSVLDADGQWRVVGYFVR